MITDAALYIQLTYKSEEIANNDIAQLRLGDLIPYLFIVLEWAGKSRVSEPAPRSRLKKKKHKKMQCFVYNNLHVKYSNDAT